MRCARNRTLGIVSGWALSIPTWAGVYAAPGKPETVVESSPAPDPTAAATEAPEDAGVDDPPATTVDATTDALGDAAVSADSPPASGTDGTDASGTNPASDPEALEPDLLAAPPAAARPPAPTRVSDSREANVRAMYRPPSNPARLNLGARASFANVGGRDEVGGRLGGVSVDVGQAWNNFGYAVTLSAWGGRVDLQPETESAIHGLFGLGPSISLGRRALVSRGYLDLQVGYDVYYGLVNRQSSGTVVAPGSGGDERIDVAVPDNVVPHGPRINLDIGLLTRRQRGGYVHGFGASVGYQPLVHSFNAELPVVHMLTIGLSYWMG